MKFTGIEEIPEAVKEVIQKSDYVGYVRVYYRNGYGSRLFFKGAESGYINEIKEAEKKGMERYTPELKSALKTVCEVLFEENNPNGKHDLYDFCRANDFDITRTGWKGYCYMAHSAFEIVVSQDDEYFCRVYFYDRNNA